MCVIKIFINYTHTKIWTRTKDWGILISWFYINQVPPLFMPFLKYDLFALYILLSAFIAGAESSKCYIITTCKCKFATDHIVSNRTLDWMQKCNTRNPKLLVKNVLHFTWFWFKQRCSILFIESGYILVISRWCYYFMSSNFFFCVCVCWQARIFAITLDGDI